MTRYLDAIPEYIPYPKFLLKSGLSGTARLIYAMLLDRHSLSKKNGWKDEEGHTYLVYTIEKLAEDLGVSKNTVKSGLNELAAAELIRRTRHGFSAPYHLYVMLPEDVGTVKQRDRNAISGCENNWKNFLQSCEDTVSEPDPSQVQKSDPMEPASQVQKSDPMQPASQVQNSDSMQSASQVQKFDPMQSVTEQDFPQDQKAIPVQEQKPALTEPENLPSQDQKTTPHRDSGQAPNHVTLKDITSNHDTAVTERAWGEFGNVMLTEAEYSEMSGAYPDIFPAMLDFLSARVRDNQIPDEPHSVILRRMLE